MLTTGTERPTASDRAYRDRKIQVLHIISNAARSRYLNYLAEYHDRDRFHVTIGTLSKAGPLQNDMRERGVVTFSLDCDRRSQVPRALARLAIRLRQNRIDILQAHLFEASLVGLGAAAIARTPLRIFTGHHSLDLLQHNRPLLHALDSLCSRALSDFVIAPSDPVKNALVAAERVSPGTIAVIPLGFDLESWRPKPGDRERIRAEFNLEGRDLIVAVGRLHWIKDFPTLLEAFGAFSREHQTATLLIVGQGPDRAELEARAGALGIANNVIFAGFRDDLSAILAAADVFLHCSLTEAFGQVLAEAAAAGKPLVSTPVGIASELIEDGVNGYVLRFKDPHHLRLILKHFFGQRHRWAAMGNISRDRSSRFGARDMVASYEAHYLSRGRTRGLHL